MTSIEVEENGLTLRCLGVPILLRGDVPRPLTQQHARLLSFLVASGSSGVEADGILDALWREELPKAGTQAVYSLLGRLEDRSDLVSNEAGRYRISESVDVDAWLFDDLVDRDDIESKVQGIRLWDGRPFDGIEAGDVVASEAARLLRKRIAATESVARKASPDQLRKVEERILGATSDDPYNEPLVIAAASALYRLNKRRDALSILQSCRSRLRTDLGLGGSVDLDAAELALLNDENPIPTTQANTSVGTVRVDPLPLTLTPRSSLFVGRSAQLEELDEILHCSRESSGRGRVVVLHGDAGIGKSELAAQFTTRSDGINVRVGPNSTGSSAAYACWLRAIPEATGALIQLSAASDPSAASLVFWRDVEHTIQTLATDAPLVIVLEDMHQTDAQSMLLFSWLASGSLPSNVVLLATTRPAVDGSPWAGIVNELRGRQDTQIATVIDIEPLSLAAVQQMVAARFPSHSPASTFRFASQVHALSQGNPLVGSALIADADEPADLVTGKELSIEEHHADSVRSRVDSVVSGVLTNAGLIGYEFHLKNVAALSEMSESAVLVHIETAMAAGLVVEADELGVFQFDHILTAEAFAQRASRVRRAQTFRSLIEFDELPAADRVRYIRGAFSASKPDEASEAASLLWEEAQKLAAAWSFSEARSACEHAVAMHRSAGDEPGLPLLICLAEVTARAGDLQQMEQYRQEAFEAAASAGKVDDMARAALAGLPDTERHGGDTALMGLLEKIDPEEIEDKKVLGEFAHQFLRTARIVDRTEVAVARVEVLTRDDLDDDDSWANFRNEQLQIEEQHNPDAQVIDELDDLANDLRPGAARTHLKFRAWLFSVVHQFDDSLTKRMDEARAELLMHPVPRIQWAFELFESALNRVGMIESTSTAETVLGTGFRLGVADAFTSFGAQSWHTLWLENRFDEAIVLLEGARGIIEPNVGWKCAEAFNLAAVGQNAEAIKLADEAAIELGERTHGLWAAPAACLLIEACSFLDKPSRWAAVAADVLLQHSGTAIVLGTGAAHFGPADLYIARALQLIGDDAATEYSARGHEQARRTGFRIWEGNK